MVILYEYAITFVDEVNLFWTGKWTGATVLFALNRYMVLLYTVYNWAAGDGVSLKVRKMSLTYESLLCLTRVSWYCRGSSSVLPQ